MGKLHLFEVVFDDDKTLYQAGEWVQGHVRIVVSKPVPDIRGIQIKYQGKAKTQWSVYESKSSGAVNYRLKEIYFKEKMFVMGRDKSETIGEFLQLEPGDYKFPFRFEVPTTRQLPHAFEGKHGRVHYKVHAKIDRPWGFNHNATKLFSVVGPTVDLNTVPDALMPIQYTDEKTVCCLCCTSGPIKASAKINKSGYVPGETILVSGFVENHSRRRIRHLTAKLVQQSHFRGKRHGDGTVDYKYQKKVLEEQKSEGCGAYRTATMDKTPILVPVVPPSELPGCDIMRIEYWVKFEACVNGTPYSLEIELPITIGTVPLQSAYQHDQSDVSQQGVVTQQPTAQEGEPKLPAPAYVEDMRCTQEIHCNYDNDQRMMYDETKEPLYAPKYPPHDETKEPLYAPRYPPHDETKEPLYTPRYPPHYNSFPDSNEPPLPPTPESMYSTPEIESVAVFNETVL